MLDSPALTLVSPPSLPTPQTGVRAIDLFAGWGGMTLGAKQAGVNVLWSGNHWPLAVETHALNHPETLHECQDLRQADWTALPEYDVLLAAPACQGHSPASQARRRAYHDALRATAFSVIDCADATEPKAIVIENVPAFVRWRLYPEYRAMFEKLGYVLEERFVTASRHGVAQRRRRFFLLATRPGVKVRPLTENPVEPAFGPLLMPAPEEAWTPVHTAPSSVQMRIERSRARHGDRFLTQHTTDHHGVPLHEPIRTITTGAAHWNLVDGDRYRQLSGRELARGMGFPDSFGWPETATIAQVTRGLGNAVCPPVAKAVVGVTAEAIAA
ncbi:DNA cytosine methyltransferase [Nocardioides sp. InS609-2]|uniref:DNA cytosine methyltransferase n=1 Tax=Nocardioides sp. InS609-2 TaxID=2760705 RepID=UPI0024A63482|nr:DNA cytosine methyltransferase [Nocardioides sp. InS609-2]